jgi:hypothetical protein
MVVVLLTLAAAGSLPLTASAKPERPAAARSCMKSAAVAQVSGLSMKPRSAPPASGVTQPSPIAHAADYLRAYEAACVDAAMWCWLVDQDPHVTCEGSDVQDMHRCTFLAKPRKGRRGMRVWCATELIWGTEELKDECGLVHNQSYNMTRPIWITDQGAILRIGKTQSFPGAPGMPPSDEARVAQIPIPLPATLPEWWPKKPNPKEPFPKPAPRQPMPCVA